MARREFYEELPSTQDRAIALARDGGENGAVVVARRQSDGRGRGDRRWVSPAGGLYVSVVLRPVDPAGILPLAIGAEISSAFAERYRVRLRLKWPNDLFAVDGAGEARKLGGILVDGLTAPGEVPAAVAGIGVNARPVGTSAPEEVRAGAVALTELTRARIDLERLEQDVVGAALAARAALEEERARKAMLSRCRGLLYGIGQAVLVDGAAAGLAVGLGDDGALLLQDEGGSRPLHAGDVRLGVGR